MKRALSAVFFSTLLAAGPALAQDDGAGDIKKGREFALQTCALCHVVVPRQLSPRRYAIGPSFSAIAGMSSTTAMSLHAFLSTPHSPMPNFVLTDDEQHDVIAYIMSLKH